jgi:hypothetical protein
MCFFIVLIVTNSSYLVLYPKYKLRYFQKAKWEPGWIEEAREIVTKRYKDCYEGQYGKKTSVSKRDAQVPSVCPISFPYTTTTLISLSRQVIMT